MSILTNNLHPDELFRYLHVRGPQKQSEKVGSLVFEPLYYDRLSPSELATIQGNIDTLYPKLIVYLGAPGELSSQQGEVSNYKGTTAYLATAEDYEKSFSELTQFLSWLDANVSVTTFSAIKTKITDLFGDDPDVYIALETTKELRCRLWDNLFTALYSPNDPFLLTLSCKYLAGLHLIEVLADNTLTDLEPYKDSIPSIYHAKPLVPRWLFELFAKLNPDSDEGTGDQIPPDDSNDFETRSKTFIRAIKEIRAYILQKETNQAELLQKNSINLGKLMLDVNVRDYENRIDDFKDLYQEIWDLQSPYKLHKGEESVFTSQTKNLILEFFGSPDILSIDHILSTFLTELGTLLNQLGNEGKEYSVRVGDAIMSSEDICDKMEDKDPCAVLPRKQFISKGSFINSTLIGDLLVTRQQLVKYDTGEVAHVEGVMQGLEKERVHRRLNRTETVTSFTKESVNESERETQTTERFSMEKETANTISQNFQIDAGVNATADYGLANVTTSLDASYGYSTQQSNSTATSYSRNVTDRALTRVKELVRESQTITVINEVEETSTHKITNSTSDHFNGVYRWLDKFYLNKIENYGRRLMFEFTVPEPANFFIFQKLKKPASNEIMEKPKPPTDIVDPSTGEGLSSHTVLTDANYSLWMAAYNATNVDAPPQEYIYITKSWRNDYGTLQSSDHYDSYASEIPIPADYMGISADIQALNHHWGTPNIVGSISTCPFYYGSSNNLPLDNTRNSVSIAWLSYGMDITVDVYIRAKRTPESYEKWKIATYGKIMDAYNKQKQAYDEWLSAQSTNSALNFISDSNNPELNRQIEKEELKKRCLELFTGQRYESFDAATNGIQNVSGYPEILFQEAITEGNLVKFFEQAFEWENITYIFYPYFWGRKTHWLSLRNAQDTSDPLFTKFLQAGYARIMVPARPDFENYLLMFNMLSTAVSSFGCAFNFSPSLFGSLGISNQFSPGVNDPVYMTVTQELIAASGWSLENPNPNLVGHYVHKVPTNLVYIVPNSITPGDPLPGLPDNSASPEIAPYV